LRSHASGRSAQRPSRGPGRDAQSSVLLLSYSAQTGGAGRAAHRLLRGLSEYDIEARMLVIDRAPGDPQVIGPASRARGLEQALRGLLDRAPLIVAPQRTGAMFSPAWAPDGIAPQVRRLAPDLVHLHWVAGGMLRIESLARLGRPLIWTMHDMWTFTGGCHYDDGCGRYVEACGRCPVLRSSRQADLSRWVMRRKRRAWRGLPITLVAPSRWLADRARASSLFRDRPVRVIPNGLDLERFQPVDPALARRLLGLPPDRSYLLFGALDPGGERRKGFGLLQAALQRLAESGWRDRLDLLVVGAMAPAAPPDLGLQAHFLGALRDELSMALALAAADAVVVPSTQENLPNMAVEAFACGRPCIGFAVGGMSEIVEDGTNGRLAAPFDTGELAAAIAWVLADEARRRTLGQAARRKAEQAFDLRVAARRYAELYAELGARRPAE